MVDPLVHRLGGVAAEGLAAFRGLEFQIGQRGGVLVQRVHLQVGARSDRTALKRAFAIDKIDRHRSAGIDDHARLFDAVERRRGIEQAIDAGEGFRIELLADGDGHIVADAKNLHAQLVLNRRGQAVRDGIIHRGQEDCSAGLIAKGVPPLGDCLDNRPQIGVGEPLGPLQVAGGKLANLGPRVPNADGDEVLIRHGETSLGETGWRPCQTYGNRILDCTARISHR